MADVYGTRALVWVVPFTGSDCKYGFRTNNTEAVLGHTAVTGAYPTGLVIGANAPRPPRATRQRATGTDSSFCSAAAVVAARAAGWKVSPGRIRAGGSSSRSKTVYVTYQGNKLAWKMPNYLYSKMSAADRTGLGILDATSADKDLIFGVSYPKLPRVKTEIFNADGSSTSRSTFCDPAALDSLPTGWRTVRASEDAI